MKTLALAVPLVMLLAAGSPQETPPAPKPLPVAPPEVTPVEVHETTPAKRETLKIELKLDGTFEPAARHVVLIKTQSWQGDMPILKVAAHGSKVKKGETLLQIDPAKLKEAVASAELDLGSAKTQHDRLTEEIKLAAEGEALQKERLERDAADSAERAKYFSEVEMALDLKDLEMGLQWMEDSIADQKEELEQIEKMYKSEELTNATRDIVLKRARRQVERSKARLESFLVRFQRAKSYDFPRALEQNKLEVRERAYALDAWRKTSPIQKLEREANLARAKANLRQQEENLAKLKKDESALTVTAPADGTSWYGQFDGGSWSGVEEALKNLKVGEKVSANQPLMTVVPSELCVKTAVAEDKIADVGPGTEAQVTAVAFPDLALTGKASPPVLIGQRKGDAFDTRFDLATVDPRIVPGLKAKLTVLVVELKDVVTVPTAAITEESGKKFVKVLESGKAVQREVGVGRTNGERTEIKTGLKEGEEVVTGKDGK
ncbi:MAG TPA: HlyD family efflux transporter periplasmic adaptor subunit [Planctomycetota bacterium]|nr:HlyD family efflux transporter periplasmic adaptor subunit [Planctomycetota bacterium]